MSKLFCISTIKCYDQLSCVLRACLVTALTMMLIALSILDVLVNHDRYATNVIDRLNCNLQIGIVDYTIRFFDCAKGEL